MRKQVGLGVVLLVMSLALSGGLVMAAEHGGDTMEHGGQTVAEPAAPAVDLDAVKEAWNLLKDSNADIAGGLENILNGDQTNAKDTLTAAAQALKESHAGLASKLDQSAAQCAVGSTKEHGGN